MLILLFFRGNFKFKEFLSLHQIALMIVNKIFIVKNGKQKIWKNISKDFYEIAITLSNVKRKLCMKRINVFVEIRSKDYYKCLYVLVLERGRTYI